MSKGILGQKQLDYDNYQSFGFLNSKEAEKFCYFVADYSNVAWAFAELKLGDFKQNLLSLKKSFAVDYQNVLDHSGTVTLQIEEFETQTSFDALNRPISITQPNDTVITNIYNIKKPAL